MRVESHNSSLRGLECPMKSRTTLSKTSKSERSSTKDLLVRCFWSSIKSTENYMLWRELTKIYLSTRSKSKILRMRRRFSFSQIIPSYWAWIMCSRMNIEYTSSWNMFVEVTFMITCSTRNDLMKILSNSTQLKLLLPSVIFIIIVSFIEILSLKMSWLMNQDISTLLTSASQNSLNHKLNKLFHFVGQQNIWHQRSLTNEGMVLLLIGGHSVF